MRGFNAGFRRDYQSKPHGGAAEKSPVLAILSARVSV